MQKIDFTDRLPATLPHVPRDSLIKFNNSWLLLNNRGNLYTYLVAYRALVYRDQKDERGNWSFSPEAPRFPGAPGTPWHEKWSVEPCVNAVEEGQVPQDRHGLYFDGIGIAEIEVNADQLYDPEKAITVSHDQIIGNSDGYEDPRLFQDEAGANIYLHAHRIEPYPQRHIPTPEFALRSPVWWAKEKSEGGLFVRVISLAKEGPDYKLGRSYLYGAHLGKRIEKNYGFFFENRKLNAVYGVAPHGEPYTLLSSEVSVDEFGDCRSEILAKKKVPEDPERSIGDFKECFQRLEAYYQSAIGNSDTVKFSSSGPLIQTAEKTWLGVGHVKVDYEIFWCLAHEMIKVAKCFFGSHYTGLKDTEIYTQLLGNKKKLEQVLWHLSMGLDEERLEKINPVKYANLSRFLKTVPDRFLADSLFTEILRLTERYSGKIHTLWSEESWLNLKGEPETSLLFHWNKIYFSFFYEIGNQESRWRMLRFSDAFMCNNSTDISLIQFATNLAECGRDYLIGFGENDHRASVAVIGKSKVNIMLRHTADNFQVRDYRFQLTDKVTSTRLSEKEIGVRG